MINKPALHELMKNCSTKYELVIVAAKRARAVIDSDPDLVITSKVNPVSLALKDIANGKLQWQQNAGDLSDEMDLLVDLDVAAELDIPDELSLEEDLALPANNDEAADETE